MPGSQRSRSGRRRGPRRPARPGTEEQSGPDQQPPARDATPDLLDTGPADSTGMPRPGGADDDRSGSERPAGVQPRPRSNAPRARRSTASSTTASSTTDGSTTDGSTGAGRPAQVPGKPVQTHQTRQTSDPGAGGRNGSRNGRSPRRGRRWLRQVDEFSAGGLVVDLTAPQLCGALIGRTDRQGRLLWSLPKGHIEAGETAEQAAVREIEEETGIAGEIVAELGTIDFWFVADGRRIHKTVRHYLLRRTGGELSDADVEVDEVAWVPLVNIRAQLAYPDERGLVDTAGRLLADTA